MSKRTTSLGHPVQIMSPDATHRLRQIALFRDLPDAVRQRFERQCRWRSVVPGEHIIGHQDASQDVCFITEGLAYMAFTDDPGRSFTTLRIILRRIFKIELIGRK